MGELSLGTARSPVYRGDARSWSIDVKAGTPPRPVDITGAVLLFTVSDDAGSAPILQLEVSSHADAVNGKTSITLLPEHTVAIPAGSWRCEIRATWTNGVGPRVWVVGTIIVADALSGTLIPPEPNP